MVWTNFGPLDKASLQFGHQPPDLAKFGLDMEVRKPNWPVILRIKGVLIGRRGTCGHHCFAISKLNSLVTPIDNPMWIH